MDVRTKALILLENEEQVKDAAKWSMEIKGEKKFIALSPFAMFELDKYRIPYRIPEDYYDSSELYKLGMDNYLKVEKICKLIDAKICDNLPIFSKLSLSPALFNFHHLKITYDAVISSLFQLLRLVDEEKPQNIFVYKSKHYPLENEEVSLLLDNRESIYSQLLELSGWEVPIISLSCNQNSEKRIGSWIQPKKLQNILIKRITAKSTLYAIILIISKFGIRGLFDILRHRYRGELKSVLLFGRYNWYDCLDELHFHQIIPTAVVNGNLKEWLSKPLGTEIDVASLLSAWTRLQENVKFRELFTYRNIDFFPLLEKRLELLINQLTHVCLKVYDETTALIKEKNIKAVLVPDLFLCVGQSLSTAARNAGIPVIGWQHGAYGYPSHLTLIYALKGLDVYLTFGHGVNHMITKYKSGRLLNTEIIPVGSAFLDALNRSMSSISKENVKGNQILYVTTNYYQNHRYISVPPPFSDNLLWQTQQAVLNTLGKFDDYQVIVKLYPSFQYRDPPLKALAEESGFKNCRFIKEGSFTEVLPSADVIILDFPSTTLLQSLITSKPLFVYTGHFKLGKEAQKLLRQRAYCFEDLYAFLEALDKFLTGKDTGIMVDLNDKEFLKKYGVYQAGEKSVERAAQIVKNIIGD